MKTLCGTGHRPQDLPNKFEYNWKKDILNIQKFILENNITKVITGMALGFDQALAVAVIKLKDTGHKIHLEAAIPCNGQDNSWNIEYKKLYRYILKKCDSKVIISDEYTQTCMQDRNKYMVDNSDIVLAFYNGKGFGGTYNCIQYAKSVKKPIVNIYTMYNVKNNMELKKVNSDINLEISTDNTEDLLDINRQIYRIEEGGHKVTIRTPRGEFISNKSLGTYIEHHVNVELGGLSDEQVTAKLTNFKSMMSHKEYVDVPEYEEQHLEYAVPLKDDNGNIVKDKDGCVYTIFDSVPLGCELAFGYKVPKTDESGKVITKTVEKTVYLDRVYSLSMGGVYCINDKSINLSKIYSGDKKAEYKEVNKIRNKLESVKTNKEMKKLAKSFKIPLAPVVCNEIIDPDDETYLLHDCNKNVIELIKKKYETISPEKKEMLLKFFGIRSKNIHISDFENFSYAMINFKMFRFNDLPLPNKVDAREFNDMLGVFKVPNAYDIMYDLAEKGMLINLENYPELQHFEEARFYEDSYRGDEEEDILD